MTPRRQHDQLEAEIASLIRLMESTPEDAITTPHLRYRIANLKGQLQAMGERPSLIPEAELFFGGGLVVDGEGLEVTFTSDILDSYQIMVTNHYSAKHYGALRRTGRRRGEEETQLYLTALPRGSFGLQLAQLHVADFITATQVADAMREVSHLLQAAGESDEAFDTSIAQFNPRVLPPLTEFIKTLHAGHGECRILTGMTEIELTQEQIAEAHLRVTATKKEDTTETMRGVFGGLVLFDWLFNFQPEQGSSISGALAEELTQEEATTMNTSFTNKRVAAQIKTTTVSTRSGRKKPSYELISMTPLEQPPTEEAPKP